MRLIALIALAPHFALCQARPEQRITIPMTPSGETRLIALSYSGDALSRILIWGINYQGQNVQVLEVNAVRERDVIFADYNFDGYIDVAAATTSGSGKGGVNTTYHVWLFDSTLGYFVPSPEVSQAGFNPLPHLDEQTIVTSESGHFVHNSQTWKWKGKKLVNVAYTSQKRIDGEPFLIFWTLQEDGSFSESRRRKIQGH